MPTTSQQHPDPAHPTVAVPDGPSAGRVTAIYGTSALVWVLVTDWVVRARATDPASVLLAQTIKGIVFVVATSLVLYTILALERAHARRMRVRGEQHRERERLLSDHVRGAVYRYRCTSPQGFEYVSPSSRELTGFTPEDFYADPELGSHLVRPGKSRADDDVRGASQVFVRRWRRKDGRTIWTEQRTRAVHDDDGNLIAIEGVAIDVTRYERTRRHLTLALEAEEASRRRAERTAEDTRRLQKVVMDLACARTRDEVVHAVVDRGMQAADAHSCVISLIDRSRDELEVIGHNGFDEDQIGEFDRLPLDSAHAPARVARTGEAVWLRSVEEGEESMPGTREVLEHFGAQSWACVPLTVSRRTIGALALSFHRPHAFDEDERIFLTALGGQAAVALHRVLLVERLQESKDLLQSLSRRLIEVQEGERQHIARELHDVFGAWLHAVRLNLHMVTEDIRRGEVPEERTVLESAGLVEKLMAEVRTLSVDLRPAMLDDRGLADALIWYAQRIAERAGIEVRVEERLAGARMSPAIETSAYRIVQECLTNVQRHSRAEHVEIGLAIEGDELVITVDDDGIGFDPRAQWERARAGGSIGLMSIHERAELAGGRTEIESDPRRGGTVVRVWLPVDAAARTRRSEGTA